jgi:hypothetical protein
VPVSEQEAATARVRVVFEAEDQLVSWWLPVLQPKTLADQVYWMPDLDEHVVCLLDEHAEFGVVLGAIYSEADAPPVASLEKLHNARARYRFGSTEGPPKPRGMRCGDCYRGYGGGARSMGSSRSTRLKFLTK